jgi:hypothetical protein
MNNRRKLVFSRVGAGAHAQRPLASFAQQAEVRRIGYIDAGCAQLAGEFGGVCCAD